MVATLLRGSNDEAKTSVVLRLASGLLFPNCRTTNYSVSSFCSFFAIYFLRDPSWICTLGLSCGDDNNSTVLASYPLHKSSWHSPCGNTFTVTIWWSSHISSEASAVFPLEYKRSESVGLQLYWSDWHSCLEFVDFPIHHNVSRCLKKYFTVGVNLSWMVLNRSDSIECKNRFAASRPGFQLT